MAKWDPTGVRSRNYGGSNNSLNNEWVGRRMSLLFDSGAGRFFQFNPSQMINLAAGGLSDNQMVSTMLMANDQVGMNTMRYRFESMPQQLQKNEFLRLPPHTRSVLLAGGYRPPEDPQQKNLATRMATWDIPFLPEEYLADLRLPGMGGKGLIGDTVLGDVAKGVLAPVRAVGFVGGKVAGGAWEGVLKLSRFAQRLQRSLAYLDEHTDDWSWGKPARWREAYNNVKIETDSYDIGAIGRVLDLIGPEQTKLLRLYLSGGEDGESAVDKVFEYFQVQGEERGLSPATISDQYYNWYASLNSSAIQEATDILESHRLSSMEYSVRFYNKYNLFLPDAVPGTWQAQAIGFTGSLATEILFDPLTYAGGIFTKVIKGAKAGMRGGASYDALEFWQKMTEIENSVAHLRKDGLLGGARSAAYRSEFRNAMDSVDPDLLAAWVKSNAGIQRFRSVNLNIRSQTKAMNRMIDRLNESFAIVNDLEDAKAVIRSEWAAEAREFTLKELEGEAVRRVGKEYPFEALSRDFPSMDAIMDGMIQWHFGRRDTHILQLLGKEGEVVGTKFKDLWSDALKPGDIVIGREGEFLTIGDDISPIPRASRQTLPDLSTRQGYWDYLNSVSGRKGLASSFGGVDPDAMWLPRIGYFGSKWVEGKRYMRDVIKYGEDTHELDADMARMTAHYLSKQSDYVVTRIADEIAEGHLKISKQINEQDVYRLLIEKADVTERLAEAQAIGLTTEDLVKLDARIAVLEKDAVQIILEDGNLSKLLHWYQDEGFHPGKGGKLQIRRKAGARPFSGAARATRNYYQDNMHRAASMNGEVTLLERMKIIGQAQAARFAYYPARWTERLTTYTPRQPFIDVIGTDDAVREFKALIDMGTMAHIPRAHIDDYLRTFIMGNEAQRWIVQTEFLMDFLGRSGALLAGGRDVQAFVKRFIRHGNAHYSQLGLDTPGVMGVGQRRAIHSSAAHASQFSRLNVMPDYRELMALSKYMNFYRRIGWGVPLHTVDAWLGRVWRPAVLLRLGYVVRNGGEEMASWMFREGPKHYVFAKLARSAVRKKVIWDPYGRKIIKNIDELGDEAHEALIMKPFTRIWRSLLEVTNVGDWAVTTRALKEAVEQQRGQWAFLSADDQMELFDNARALVLARVEERAFSRAGRGILELGNTMSNRLGLFTHEIAKGLGIKTKQEIAEAVLRNRDPDFELKKWVVAYGMTNPTVLDNQMRGMLSTFDNYLNFEKNSLSLAMRQHGVSSTVPALMKLPMDYQRTAMKWVKNAGIDANGGEKAVAVAQKLDYLADDPAAVEFVVALSHYVSEGQEQTLAPIARRIVESLHPNDQARYAGRAGRPQRVTPASPGVLTREHGIATENLDAVQEPVTVMITGSRFKAKGRADLSPREVQRIQIAIDEAISSLPEGSTVRVGGAKGVDQYAENVVKRLQREGRDIKLEVYAIPEEGPESWARRQAGGAGFGAGPIRNKRMLEGRSIEGETAGETARGTPDAVFAFHPGKGMEMQEAELILPGLTQAGFNVIAKGAYRGRDVPVYQATEIVIPLRQLLNAIGDMHPTEAEIGRIGTKRIGIGRGPETTEQVDVPRFRGPVARIPRPGQTILLQGVDEAGQPVRLIVRIKGRTLIRPGSRAWNDIDQRDMVFNKNARKTLNNMEEGSLAGGERHIGSERAAIQEPGRSEWAAQDRVGGAGILLDRPAELDWVRLGEEGGRLAPRDRARIQEIQRWLDENEDAIEQAFQDAPPEEGLPWFRRRPSKNRPVRPKGAQAGGMRTPRMGYSDIRTEYTDMMEELRHLQDKAAAAEKTPTELGHRRVTELSPEEAGSMVKFEIEYLGPDTLTMADATTLAGTGRSGGTADAMRQAFNAGVPIDQGALAGKPNVVSLAAREGGKYRSLRDRALGQGNHVVETEEGGRTVMRIYEGGTQVDEVVIPAIPGIEPMLATQALLVMLREMHPSIMRTLAKAWDSRAADSVQWTLGWEKAIDDVLDMVPKHQREMWNDFFRPPKGGITQQADRGVQEVKRYSTVDTRANPEKIYLFGDNLEQRGKGGQAQIRDEDNAIGIPTKKRASMEDDAFFIDDEFEDNKRAIDAAFANIPDDVVVVLPSDGLGTGRARLDSRPEAARTFTYLNSKLDELRTSRGMAGPVERRGVDPNIMAWFLNNPNPSALTKDFDEITDRAKKAYETFLGTPEGQDYAHSMARANLGDRNNPVISHPLPTGQMRIFVPFIPQYVLDDLMDIMNEMPDMMLRKVTSPAARETPGTAHEVEGLRAMGFEDEAASVQRGIKLGEEDAAAFQNATAFQAAFVRRLNEKLTRLGIDPMTSTEAVKLLHPAVTARRARGTAVSYAQLAAHWADAGQDYFPLVVGSTDDRVATAIGETIMEIVAVRRGVAVGSLKPAQIASMDRHSDSFFNRMGAAADERTGQFPTISQTRASQESVVDGGRRANRHEAFGDDYYGMEPDGPRAAAEYADGLKGKQVFGVGVQRLLPTDGIMPVQMVDGKPRTWRVRIYKHKAGKRPPVVIRAGDEQNAAWFRADEWDLADEQIATGNDLRNYINEMSEINGLEITHHLSNISRGEGSEELFAPWLREVMDKEGVDAGRIKRNTEAGLWWPKAPENLLGYQPVMGDGIGKWQNLLSNWFDGVVNPMIGAMVREPLFHHYFTTAWKQTRDVRGLYAVRPGRFDNLRRTFGNDLTHIDDGQQFVVNELEDFIHFDMPMAASDPTDPISGLALAINDENPGRVQTAIREIFQRDADFKKGVKFPGWEEYKPLTAQFKSTMGRLEGMALKDDVLIEDFFKWIKNRKLTFETHRDVALKRAMTLTSAYIDDHRIRSQFQRRMGTAIPFWFAEDNFLRRFGRGLKHNPLMLRNVHLTMNAGVYSGLVEEDEYGSKHLIVPGNEMITNAMLEIQDRFPVVSKFFGGALGAVAPRMGTTLKIIPGYDVEHTGSAGFGPLLAVPINLIGNRDATVKSTFEHNLIGGRYTSDSGAEIVWKSAVPAILARPIAIAGFDNQAKVKAQQDVIRYRAITGRIPDQQTIAAQANPEVFMEQLFDEIAEEGRQFQLLQALMWFFTPAAGRLASLTTHNAWQWNEEFYKLLEAGVPYEEAYGVWQENIIAREGSFDPFQYSPFRTATSEKIPFAVLESTQETNLWLVDHEPFVKNYKYTSAYFMPRGFEDEDDPYSAEAKTRLITYGLRHTRTPEEFLERMYYDISFPKYANARHHYLKNRYTAKAAGADTTQMDMRWHAESRMFMLSNPVFAKIFESGDAREIRDRTVGEMELIIADPSIVPDGKYKADVLEAMTVVVGFNKEMNGMFGLTGRDIQDQRNEVRVLAYRRMREFVQGRPWLNEIYYSVFLPMLGDTWLAQYDAGLIDTGQML